MNLTLVHDTAYSFADLGDFPLGDASPMSAGGAPFSWYVSGIKSGGVLKVIVDRGANVTSDTLDIPAGTTNATLYLTGLVARPPWYGDTTGAGQFTLQIGEAVSPVPEPSSAVLLGVTLGAALLWRMFRGKRASGRSMAF